MDLLDRTILANPYIPHAPTEPQAAFLTLPQREALYGGAAGGGKSDALLMAALQYVHIPDYTALLLRRSFPDLAMPGAIMDRAKDWLGGTDARWNEQRKTWRFPSGATLTFGYLQDERDKYRYQGAEFQFVGFDELTQFLASPYRYLFSRLRKLKGANVPIRMRGATNPGGIGHEWVLQRFIEEGELRGRPFVPAKLTDNPYLDAEEYVQSLSELSPTERAQLLNGDWFARPEGSKFRREWFEIIERDAVPAQLRRVRYWDLAATEPAPGKDPDYTAGALVGEASGIYYILDLTRDRLTPGGVEALICQTATLDGIGVDVHLEQEPGSSGVAVIDRYRRVVLRGFPAYADRVTGSKEVRANPFSAAAQAGNVKLVRGPWINDFLEEAVAFPGGPHDDQIDAVSGAVQKLARPRGVTAGRSLV